MQLIDIHTHTLKEDAHKRITDSGTEALPSHPCSVGVHPWRIIDDGHEQLQKVAEAASRPTVVAIGECGLDTLKSPAPIETQIKILLRHIEISEALHKPLILHIVKSHHLLLKIAKETPHTQAWIVHGFRGGAAQARQLTAAGLYLSFGARFSAAAVEEAPADRIFIESDESPLPLEDIYAAVAQAKGLATQDIIRRTALNAARCNIRL